MPFKVHLPWPEQSTYTIILVSHVGMTLATLQAVNSFWNHAHRSHLGFIGVGRRNILLIPSALLRLGASLSQKKLPEINIETL